MTFRLGYRDFVRNLWFNILIVLQLAVMFFLCIVFVSTTEYRFRLYSPFEVKFASTGMLKCFTNGVDYYANTGHALTEDEIIAGNDHIADVIGTSYANYTLKEYNQDGINVCIYGPEIYEYVRPRLESGVWLDKAPREPGVVNVVATGNPYGFQIGDVVEGSFEDMDKNSVPLTIRIVGMISDGVTLPLYNHYDNSVVDLSLRDYRGFYTTYSYQQSEDPYFFVDRRDIEENYILHWLMGSALIVYKEGLSEAQKAQADSFIESLDSWGNSPSESGISMELINENSRRYIWEQVYILLPILAGVWILILTGSFCGSAIHVKRQLRNYGVYYINGSRWMQCGWVNIWSNLIITGIAALMCTLAFMIGDVFGFLKDNTVASFGPFPFLACLSVALLNLIFAGVVPFLLLRKATPVEVLRTNR